MSHNVEKLGFVGVGTLAKAMVRGLRRRWPELSIHLSPRSDRLSSALAEGDVKTIRHQSNAAVVEASDAVVLTMRPSQLNEAVLGLPFRSGQLVLSCVAGVALAEMQALCAPASVCRVIPVPTIERREGPIVVFPAMPPVRRLLDGMGDLIEVPDEPTLLALSAGSAFMSSYFTLHGVLARWMETKGADRVSAATYARSLLRALAETSVQTDIDHLAALVQEHETPGGLNFRVRSHLDGKGWFAAVESAFDAISKLHGADLTVSERNNEVSAAPEACRTQG